MCDKPEDIRDRFHNELDRLIDDNGRRIVYAGAVGFLIGFIPKDRHDDFIEFVKFVVDSNNNIKRQMDFEMKGGD